MNDRHDLQTSHVGRISGISARERALVLAVIGLVGLFIVAMAIPGDEVRVAIDGDPTRQPAPTSSAPTTSSATATEPIRRAGPPDPTWAATAIELRGSVGEQFDIACPPNGTIEPIWGTNVYTDHSSICTAAVHLAFITPGQGGLVQIVMRPGLDAFTGTSLNGVVSGSRGRWPGSFEMRGTPPPAFGEAPPPSPVDGSWAAIAQEHRGAFDQRFEYPCPANGVPAPIWGTGAYTDDSSICTAAVHAGVIDREAGGTVTIVIREGRALYPGSFRNGVRSMAWDRWEGSFTFLGQVIDGPRLSTAEEHRGAIGETFDYQCPAHGPLGPVWGTGIYTDDSAVCTAAVHVGVISHAEGATVTIVIEPGLDSYSGSSRNGVRSESWGSWEGSFSFVGS